MKQEVRNSLIFRIISGSEMKKKYWLKDWKGTMSTWIRWNTGFYLSSG